MTAPLKTLLLGSACALLFGGTALAQTHSAVQRSFEADYFSQYAPTTALEMVRRIPGFQVRGGNNARGLGTGGANVLLNGQELVGKGNDALNQIGRISAVNVVRIDIVDGTSFDIPGLSGQVANVITKSSKGVTGSWEWTPEFRQRQEPNLLRGNVKLSGEQGTLAWAAELRHGMRRNGDYGMEIRREADGTVFEDLNYRGRYNSEAPGASLNLTWKPDDERTANLNLDGNLFNFVRTSTYDITGYTPRGDSRFERFVFGEDEWNAKIDGDYEFPFAEGKLKMIGYYRAEHSPTRAQFEVYDNVVGLSSHTRFDQTADEGEAIAKAEYSWSKGAGRDWQATIEGVYNFLDVENQFIDVLDASNSGSLSGTKVEENRGEATLTHTYKLSDKWTLQGNAGIEYSEISQGTQKRKFTRPKGFLVGTYTPNNTVSFIGKIQREVGQLNFFDFISSVSLQDELDQAANPDLVPQQAWLVSLDMEKTFPGGHTLTILSHARQVSDLVDRIPIGVDGDAVGNIDDAWMAGIHFETSFKGEPFGLKGMELEANIDFHTSGVKDAVTGQTRKFNGMRYSNWEVGFRHDIPDTDWAWGFYLSGFENATNYRTRSTNRTDQRFGWNDVFIEHKDVFGMKVQLEVSSVIKISDYNDLIFYDARRDIGTIDRIENRRRDYDGPYIQLVVSDTF